MALLETWCDERSEVLIADGLATAAASRAASGAVCAIAVGLVSVWEAPSGVRSLPRGCLNPASDCGIGGAACPVTANRRFQICPTKLIPKTA